MFKRLILLSAVYLSTMDARAQVETYKIDTDHSFANWSIRHVVAKTTGTFQIARGKLGIDRGNLANSSVEAVISVYTLDSNHRRRDIHLLSDEFLDAHKHAEIKFVSTRVIPNGKDGGTLIGQLTLHGVTREVSLSFATLGTGADPWGGYRSGFEARTVINRSDFGITKGLELGVDSVIGNEIDLTLLVEGIRTNADGSAFDAAAAERVRKAEEEKRRVAEEQRKAAVAEKKKPQDDDKTDLKKLKDRLKDILR